LNTWNQKIPRPLACATFIIFTLSLSACSEDMGDLSSYVEEVKARPGQPLEPIKAPLEFKEIPPFSTAKDPFESFIAKEKVVIWTDPPNPPWPGHNPEDLERYALDSLRMVGIIQQGDEHWALINAPDGAIHRVKVGNFIGKNYGKVTHVAETRIDLTEKVSDGKGKWDDRPASMALIQ
jgi:type IV pilus assembly protein PilP